MQSRAGRLKAIKNQINPLIGYPSLDINFAAVNEILDPRITFSRTSNATVVGSDGLIQYAPHNLLTYSEQFDNAVWNASGCTISANTTTAPDATSTADRMVEGTGPVDPRLPVNVTTATGITLTLSVYVKEDPTSAKRYLNLTFNSGFSSLQGAVFDLGIVEATTVNAISSSIIPIGNGWYRCSVTTQLTTSSVQSFRIRSTNTNSTSNITAPSTFTGDGVSGLFIWGAQLNEGALQPYYSTTVKNLLGYSQNFENAAWIKNNSSIATSTVIGPFGFDGGQKLVEDTVSGTPYISESNVVNAGVPYTISVYAKEAQQTPKRYLDLLFPNTQFGSTKRATFDLSAGTYVTTNSPDSASITPIGNGWYRCQVSATCVTSGTTNTQIRIATTYPDTLAPYTGDGTSGIYIFGAQLSDSASLDTYSYNPVAAPTSTAYYGPRFDYDPATLAPKGLLIEEQRTNLVLNSDTLSTQSVTVTAQAYTLSFYGTGTITLSGTSTGSLVGAGAYPSRVSLTFTPTAGTLTLTVTGSVRYAQLEAGAFPTSYIPTTSATVTRAADNASMVGSNFSSWYNQSEGTIYSQWMLGGDNTSVTVYNINDTTSANYIRNRYDSAGTANDNAVTVSSVVQQTLTTTNQIALYAMYKNAMAYKQNDFARSANNTLITGSTGNIPVVSQMTIGGIVGDYLNGHIQSIKYYPTRLPNGTLQGLTA